jgi:hypothetical protein
LGHPKIAFMYQPTPDSSWKRSVCPFGIDFTDTTHDHRYCTPVLTPYNDTSWVIAAGAHSSDIVGGVRGLVCRTTRRHDPVWSLINADTAFNLAADKTRLALFPTVASLPIVDSMYPVRMAWQMGDDTVGNDIYHRRVKSVLGSAVLETLYKVTLGLNACDNKHPSIAFNATKVKVGATSYDVYYDDNVSWDALMRSQGATTGYWPVARARHERISGGMVGHLIGKGWWGVYDVFDEYGSTGYTYPQFSASSRIYDGKFNLNPKGSISTYHEWMRIAWTQASIPHFASWDSRWLETRLKEDGRWPSIGQRSDSVIRWTDSTTVPKAIGYVDLKTDSIGQVRATNGLFPFIARPVSDMHVTITPSNPVDTVCKTPSMRGRIGWAPSLVIPTAPPGPAIPFDWAGVDVAGQDYSDCFCDAQPAELHTEPFPVRDGDHVVVSRTWVLHDLQSIRDSMTNDDQILWRLTLHRYSDSSYIGTIDSMSIRKAEVYWAGYTPGIDTENATFAIPSGFGTDSVFVQADLVRLDTSSNLVRTLTVYLDSGATEMGAKRANSQLESRTTLALDLHPNPFNPTTQIDATVIKGTETQIAVYDLLGTEVLTLYSGVPVSTRLSLTLDGKDLASGNYLVRVISGGQAITKKIELLK